jgi:aromatic amino acid aminotransferase I
MASVERGALVTKGSWFYADEGYREQDGMFFRATFAAAPFEQIDLAIQRFGAAVRDVFGLHDAVVGNETENGSLDAPGDKPALDVSVQNGLHQQEPQNGYNGHA